MVSPGPNLLKSYQEEKVVLSNPENRAGNPNPIYQILCTMGSELVF